MWIKGKNIITILTQETKFPKHKDVFEYSILNYKKQSKINQQESKRYISILSEWLGVGWGLIYF